MEEIKLTLERRYKKKDYTIGILFINGEYFCETLEDTDRGLDDKMDLNYIKKKKIKDRTAIPTGTYEVDMTKVSPKYSNYAKYPYTKEFQAKMPRLRNVKGFDGILIHAGNNHNHTSGCILVGQNKEKGKLLNSQAIWKELMLILRKAKRVTITIK